MDAVGYALASAIEPYRWKTVTSLPFTEPFVRAELIGSKVYVVGKDRLQVYNIDTGVWSQESPMPSDRRRTRFSSCVVGTDIYVIGGVYTDISSGSYITGLHLVDIYDTVNKVWRFGPSVVVDSVGYSRLDAGCESIDGSIYFIGGRGGLYFGGTGDDTTDTTLVLNVTTGVWTKKAALPSALSDIGTCVKSGVIYTCGGFFEGGTTEGYRDSIYEYAPATNTWTLKSTLYGSRGGTAAVTDGDRIYVLGGGGTTLLEWFSPPSSRGILQSPTVIRGRADAVYYNGVIYAFGGGTARVDAYYTADQPDRGTLLAWLATR